MRFAFVVDGLGPPLGWSHAEVRHGQSITEFGVLPLVWSSTVSTGILLRGLPSAEHGNGLEDDSFCLTVTGDLLKGHGGVST